MTYNGHLHNITEDTKRKQISTSIASVIRLRMFNTTLNTRIPVLNMCSMMMDSELHLGASTATTYSMGRVSATIADSIAIKVLHDGKTAIIGVGNELHLFDIEAADEDDTVSSRIVLRQVLAVRLQGKVHGIELGGGAPNAHHLLVYGEKQFILLAYTAEYEFKELYRAHLTDWISAASFLDDGGQFVLLTAHSVLLRFAYAANGCDFLCRVSCSDKSTLYCGHLHGNEWRRLVVFAGNAFGEVLIWQPSNCSDVADDKAKVQRSVLLQRLAGHNGVIFSIDYDDVTRKLITTSDDRSVKWWQVSFANSNGTCSWSRAALKPLASGYGHLTRVFRGRIIHNGDDHFALSVGEDSYFCLWRHNGELIFKRRQQFGATIWDFAYDAARKTIFTVGSTGNLVAYSLRTLLSPKLHNDSVGLLLPSLCDVDSSEYVAKVKFLNDSMLIGVTSANRLVHTSAQNGDFHTTAGRWKDVAAFVGGYKCTVLEVFDNRIALCGYRHLTLLQYIPQSADFQMLFDGPFLNSVIRAFHFFSSEKFIVCDDCGGCVVLFDAMRTRRQLELPKCKEPWLTTALLFNDDRHLLISNRQGNLMLFKLSIDKSRYTLQQVVKHPHGNLGATSLKMVATNTEHGGREVIVRSAGHDNCLRVHAVDLESSELRSLTRTLVPVAWVEEVINFSGGGGGGGNNNILLGFNDNHFVVWTREHDFLLQLPCGGGHRCWHFLFSDDGSNIRLVFVRKKRVRVHQIALFGGIYLTVPPPNRWHMAPCNAMSLLELHDKRRTLVITAADDSLIKVHRLSEGGLCEQAELHAHISSVRALKVIASGKDCALILSGGGRAQLCVTEMDLNTYRLEGLINHTLRQSVERAAAANTSSNCSDYTHDPETRVMSIAACCLLGQPSSHFHIYVGCSDGYVRKFLFNRNERQMVQKARELYCGKCVLQVHLVANDRYVLIGCTDGILRIYDLCLEKCLFELRHHASGTNALATHYDSESATLRVLSGGDDQTVSYSILKLLMRAQFEVTFTCRLPHLHTAQVTAAAISGDGRYGFTSGVDQQLLKLNLQTCQIEDSFHSCVADIKGVCVGAQSNRCCLLFGNGLQVYSFK